MLMLYALCGLYLRFLIFFVSRPLRLSPQRTRSCLFGGLIFLRKNQTNIAITGDVNCQPLLGDSMVRIMNS